MSQESGIIIILTLLGVTLFGIGNWMSPMNTWVLLSSLGWLLIGAALGMLIFWQANK